MYAAFVDLVLSAAREHDIRVLELLMVFPYQWLVLVQQPADFHVPYVHVLLRSWLVAILRVSMYQVRSSLTCGTMILRHAKQLASRATTSTGSYTSLWLIWNALCKLLRVHVSIQ